MPKLSQLLAIEKGVKTSSYDGVTKLHRASQQDQLLSGISRVYTPRDEEGEELPPESTRVQIRHRDVLNEVRNLLSELFDVTATKDEANRHARADVVVDGETVVAQVPAVHLLFLEKQLDDLRKFLSSLPTLDPSMDWTWDGASSVYKTPETKTTRSKKVPRVIVRYEATDKHPAQTEMFNEDKIVGDWTTTKFSGALTMDRKRQLMERVTALQKAVKFAREEANTSEQEMVREGEQIFSWLLAD